MITELALYLALERARDEIRQGILASEWFEERVVMYQRMYVALIEGFYAREGVK